MSHRFASETDTEVIAHLIHHYFQKNRDLFAATRQAAAEQVGPVTADLAAAQDKGDEHADDGEPAARMARPRLPPRLNFVGTAWPALTTFRNGRFEIGWKKPLKG